MNFAFAELDEFTTDDIKDLHYDAEAWGDVSEYAGHGRGRTDLFGAYCRAEIL